MDRYISTKTITLGSTTFRQPLAKSHCRFIHGYNLYAKFWFEARHLDENGWVVDFGALKQLRKRLKKQFDHTTLISRNDPLLNEFLALNEVGGINLKIMDSGVGIEKFAKYCFDQTNYYIKNMTKDRCWVFQVEVFEHDKNSAIYKKQ